MASSDLDLAELHVSIKDYFTKAAYVDPSGKTSLDLPYESLELVDQMYEPTAQELPTATITLPSLLAMPELRPLLQKIKEGNRVEIYNFQPDCGDPVFAGFISPNGITEQDGKTTIAAMDTLGQLRWQHVRKYEFLNFNAAGFYDRARSVWTDLLAEDFAGASPAGDYLVSNSFGAAPRFTPSGLLLIGSGTSGGASKIYANQHVAGFVPQAGDHYLCEAFFTLTPGFTGVCTVLGAVGLSDTGGANLIRGYINYQGHGNSPYPDIIDMNIQGQGAGGSLASLPQHITNTTLAGSSFTNRLALDVFFNSDGTVSVTLYVDNVNVGFARVKATPVGGVSMFPYLELDANTTSDQVLCSKWRVRKLVPTINKAPRFYPQTPDALPYQPNGEENLQLLQLIAQKDNAEYRPVYKPWPQTDELELDVLGTLGAFPSRTLGYDQAGASPAIDASSAAPFAVDADPPYGSFLVAPPFRIEEGWNLEAPPQIGQRETAHANDILEYGSATLDSQIFAEDFAPGETGRPQHSPSGASYPYFEQVVNDDRAGLESLIRTLAVANLTARTDGVPSLTVQMVDEVWSAFRWRAGDAPYVITRSLRNNVEQEMRVVKIAYKAGSPSRQVVLGRLERDPEQLRALHEAAMMSWLYDQSGTSPTVYVFPFTGGIASAASTTVWNLPLDQYTTGFSIAYAAFHWFTDAHVAQVVPIVNGQTMGNPSSTPSDTDSGLVIVTSAFQAAGVYQISFNNQDAVTRQLTGAFLVLRIKS